MTGFIRFHQDLQDLRNSTAILEVLEWDEKKFEDFMEELNLMLTAAPPNIDKALFWLRSTPWDTFDNQTLPQDVYHVLEKSFRIWDSRMKQARQARARPREEDNEANKIIDDEWN